MGKESTIEVSFKDESTRVELEEVHLSFSYGEARPRRMGTLAFLAAAVPKSKDEELEAVHQVILSYETLPADKVEASLGDLTTDPYTSIADGLVNVIDMAAIRAWHASPDFANIKQKYHGSQPHAVGITNFQASIIDESTASVNYSIVEELPDGSKVYGSSAAVLIKGTDGRWKIAVHCQHPTS
jgi:hypothetical protein